MLYVAAQRQPGRDGPVPLSQLVAAREQHARQAAALAADQQQRRQWPAAVSNGLLLTPFCCLRLRPPARRARLASAQAKLSSKAPFKEYPNVRGLNVVWGSPTDYSTYPGACNAGASDQGCVHARIPLHRLAAVPQGCCSGRSGLKPCVLPPGWPQRVHAEGPFDVVYDNNGKDMDSCKMLIDAAKVRAV